MKLPQETPFFDILQFQCTLMEQKINHLVVQCWENHVSTLVSKALSEIMTGINSPLFLPRLALAKLSLDQISSYFKMQDRYSKSLKSLPLFPTMTNLDKPRTEFSDDGTIVERSTREWAEGLFIDRSDPSARCEVVNGGIDQKAYLLVPAQHWTVAKEYLRQYRLRINPLGRREARFRDSLPGLPSVIHIDNSTQRNLDLLETMSSFDVWQSAPPSVRNGPNPSTPVDQKTNDSTTFQKATSSPTHWSGTKKSRNNPRVSVLGNVREQFTAPPSEQELDEQTTSTKSATQSMATPSLLSTATLRRLNELEALFRSQQTAINENSQQGKRTDSALQQTISTLQENSAKLVLTMERQQDSHVQLVELSTRVSRLTEVLDQLASQIEVLTNLTLHSQNRHST